MVVFKNIYYHIFTFDPHVLSLRTAPTGSLAMAYDAKRGIRTHTVFKHNLLCNYVYRIEFQKMITHTFQFNFLRNFVYWIEFQKRNCHLAVHWKTIKQITSPHEWISVLSVFNGLPSAPSLNSNPTNTAFNRANKWVDNNIRGSQLVSIVGMTSHQYC